MGWKSRTIVDERVRFIAELQTTELSFAEVCRRFGISRKSGYKWVQRYEEGGPEALVSRASAPRESPQRTPVAMVDRVLALRKDHPTWGPKKLRVLLGNGAPSASTIGELLKAHGLIRPRRRRPIPPRVATGVERPEHPNDTWCVDFKGHFPLADKRRCYPLTLTDEVTRYLLLCEGLLDADGAHVRPLMERAFREFGVPWRIRSDNGPPFASQAPGGLTALNVWWIRLGITPERITPGHPEENGRHERMHRTLKAEVPIGAQSLAEQQRHLDRFRHLMNDVRPHEALGQATPASHYTPSPRLMPSVLRSPEYPENMRVRRLDDKGAFYYGGKKQLLTARVSSLIAYEPVGLETIEEDLYRLWYGPLELGRIALPPRPFAFEPCR